MAASAMTKLDRIIKGSQRFIMIVCSGIIVLIVGVAALLRYLVGVDLYGAEEFLTIAAFWMYFIGAIYATHTRSHISAEVFSVYCRNATLRRLVHFFQLGVTIALSLLYTYWGWGFFYWSLTEGGTSTVWQIPLVVSHTAVSLGFVMMSWYFILEFAGDAADLLRIKIRIAGQYAPEHPATQSLYQLKNKIEKASEGKIRIQVCPNSELGDYTQVHEGLSKGTIGMALISVPSQLDHRLEAIYLPYLATEYTQAREIYSRSSALFQEVDRVHSALGIKFLGFNMQGFGGLALKKKPRELTIPDCKKDTALRVPPMEVFKINMKDQGFDPVTVPFNEVENVLETESVDGLAGCPPLAVYHHFRGRIKYYLVNRNFIETTSYLMSESLWNSLDPQQQKLIHDCVDELSAESTEYAEQLEQEYLAKLVDAGIEVTTLTEPELQAWVKQTRSVTWPKLYSYLSPELVESLRATLALNDSDAALTFHSAADPSGRTSS
jgi:TRAP-type C4-dicarboxylate transport system substrate-binding protein